ncbi:kinase-like domain-containing protein [Haematococcus lacustris]
MRPELSVNISFERDLVMGHCIGKGAAGTVHVAVYEGQQVAVKMFNQQNLSDGDLRTFQQEVLVLSRTNHPSVVGLYGASLQLPNLCLVEELCDTCLEKFIYTGEEAASSKVTTTVLLSLAYDITCGLAYLHPSILHRDLKPANVLIKFDPGKGGLPRAKISDFGLARVRAAATLHTQALEVGTVAYMAPECFNLDQTGITHKCDIFSLGMVLWELAHWERPWKNLPSAAIIYNAAIAGKRPEFTASEGLCPPRLRKLIEACWAAEPLVRPAAADLAKEICLLAEELDISLPGMHAANA